MEWVKTKAAAQKQGREVYIAKEQIKGFAFAGFESQQTFLEFYKHSAPPHHLYELILPQTATFIYFDLDSPPPADNAAATDALVQDFLQSANEYFRQHHEIPAMQWEVSESNRPTKQSYHVRAKRHALRDHIQRKHFINHFAAWMSQTHPRLASVLDKSVYKSSQLFRLVGSSKRAAMEYPLTPLPSCSKSTKDHMIGVYAAPAAQAPPPLPPEYLEYAISPSKQPTPPQSKADAFYTPVQVPPEHSQRITNLMLKTHIWGSHIGIRNVTTHNNVIIFKLCTRYCAFACRHHTTNTNYISFDPTSGSFVVSCYSDGCADRHMCIDENTFYTTHWHEDYAAATMRDYTSPHAWTTFNVQANMGVGKTQALYRYIKNAPNASVLFVTFRIALSAKYQEDLAAQDTPFVNYLDPSTTFTEPRLIVCINSLHKVRKVDYDIVCLDEFDSICEAMNMRMHNKGQICNTLHNVLQLAPTAFFIDANLDTPRCRNFIARSRPVHTHKWIRNSYVRPTNRTLHLHQAPAKAPEKSFAKALELLAADHNVVYISTSKKVCLDLEQLLPPNTTYKVYTADTDATQKFADFRDVNVTFKSLQLLVYNPALSAGISMTTNHFDVIVAHASFSPMSCSVHTFLQMLYRVRQLTKGDVHLYLDTSHTYALDINPNNHIAALERKETYIYKLLGIALESTNVYIVNDSKLQFNDADPFNRLFIDNIVDANACLNDYAGIITRTLEVNYHVTIKTQPVDESAATTSRPPKQEDVIEVPANWSPQLWEQLCLKATQGAPMTKNMKALVSAGRYLKEYNVDFGKLDQHFVNTYANEQTLRQYRAYKLTQKHGTPESLNAAAQQHYAWCAEANASANAFVNTKHLEYAAVSEMYALHPPTWVTTGQIDYVSLKATENPDLYGIPTRGSKNTTRKRHNTLKQMFAALGYKLEIPPHASTRKGTCKVTPAFTDLAGQQ